MQHTLHHHCDGHCWRAQERECNNGIPSTTRYDQHVYQYAHYANSFGLYHACTAGPQDLSAAVLSPTSVYLTWVAPCDTQQYHIHYKGTCGTNVDEGSLDTNRTEYTLDELQEGINYTFTVNQTGFGGGRVLSTGPVYAMTFTAGMYIG